MNNRLLLNGEKKKKKTLESCIFWEKKKKMNPCAQSVYNIAPPRYFLHYISRYNAKV